MARITSPHQPSPGSSNGLTQLTIAAQQDTRNTPSASPTRSPTTVNVGPVSGIRLSSGSRHRNQLLEEMTTACHNAEPAAKSDADRRALPLYAHSNPHSASHPTEHSRTFTPTPASLTTAASNRSNHSSPYTLSIQPQPPRYVFVNTYFTVRVFLVDVKNVLKTGWKVDLVVRLHYSDTGEAVSEEMQAKILEISKDTPPVINGDGSVSLQLRCLQVSMLHGNRSFYLSVSAGPEAQQQYGQSTMQTFNTTSFSVIRHMIRIVQQPPGHWYKDEGGRDKTMTIHCMLVDANQQTVTGRDVPLQLTLMYDNSTPIGNGAATSPSHDSDVPMHPRHAGDPEKQMAVKNQSILKLPADIQPRIDTQGQCTIKLRIEEVSKNHDKKAFAVRISPDTAYSPMNHDISSDTTTPVVILSKRNKRRRKDGTYSHSIYDDEDPPVPGTIAAQAIAQAQAAAAAAQQATATYSPHHTQHQHSNGSASQAGERSQSSNGLLLNHSTSAGSVPLHEAMAHGASNGMGALMRAADSSPVAGSGQSSAPPTTIDGQPVIHVPITLPKHDKLVAALNTTIQWCQLSIKSFLALEWQHIGFEVTEDGGINLHRPLYRCPGCWTYKDTIRPSQHQPSCMLYKVTQQYQSQVVSQLNEIVNHVNMQEAVLQAAVASGHPVGAALAQQHASSSSTADQGATNGTLGTHTSPPTSHSELQHHLHQSHPHVMHDHLFSSLRRSGGSGVHMPLLQKTSSGSGLLPTIDLLRGTTHLAAANGMLSSSTQLQPHLPHRQSSAGSDISGVSAAVRDTQRATGEGQGTPNPGSDSISKRANGTKHVTISPPDSDPKRPRLTPQPSVTDSIIHLDRTTSLGIPYLTSFSSGVGGSAYAMPHLHAGLSFNDLNLPVTGSNSRSSLSGEPSPQNSANAAPANQRSSSQDK